MGKRGRPMQFGKTLTIRAKPGTIAGLKALAERWEISSSDVMRELIAREVYETFDAGERSRLGIS